MRMSVVSYIFMQLTEITYLEAGWKDEIDQGKWNRSQSLMSLVTLCWYTRYLHQKRSDDIRKASDNWLVEEVRRPLFLGVGNILAITDLSAINISLRRDDGRKAFFLEDVLDQQGCLVISISPFNLKLARELYSSVGLDSSSSTIRCVVSRVCRVM